MSKIFLVITFFSLNIESVPRLGGLLQTAGTRLFCANPQITKAVKPTISFSKQIGLDDLSSTPRTAIGKRGSSKLGLFKAPKGKGYSISFVVNKAVADPGLFDIYKNDILTKLKLNQLSIQNIDKLCGISKAHALCLVRAVSCCNVPHLEGIESVFYSIASSRPEACEMLKNEVLDRCGIFWIHCLCRKSKDYAIILANAIKDRDDISQDKLMVVATSCPEAFGILFS